MDGAGAAHLCLRSVGGPRRHSRDRPVALCDWVQTKHATRVFSAAFVCGMLAKLTAAAQAPAL
jgi:hypothetical protein